MSAYEKCEILLKNYNNYKLGLTTDSGKVAKRCVEKIDKALEALKDDEEKYFQAVVDKWNEEPPKSIFD